MDSHKFRNMVVVEWVMLTFTPIHWIKSYVIVVTAEFHLSSRCIYLFICFVFRESRWTCVMNLILFSEKALYMTVKLHAHTYKKIILIIRHK